MWLSDIGIIFGNDRDVAEERIIVFLWSARRSNSSLEDEEMKCKEGEGLGGRWRILEMAISAGSLCEKGGGNFWKESALGAGVLNKWEETEGAVETIFS
jgi:hypothetical protein